MSACLPWKRYICNVAIRIEMVLDVSYFVLLFICAVLPDAAAGKATEVARDCYEYIKNIDYQTYYESVGGTPGTRGGSAQKAMFEFSLKSASTARLKLTEFLALMPKDQLDAAKQQVSGEL